jgi:hypothetical protein
LPGKNAAFSQTLPLLQLVSSTEVFVIRQLNSLAAGLADG